MLKHIVNKENSMKKLIAILLSLAFVCIGFCGCNNDKKVTEESKEEVLSDSEFSVDEIAQTHAQFMVDGEFDKIINDGNKEFQKSLNAKELKEAWDTLTSNHGEYVGVYSTDKTVKESETVFEKKLEFEKSGVLLTLCYDNENKLAGIWIKNTVIAKEDELSENEIKIEVGEYNLTGVVNKADDNSPVVIMVQGSGSSDYNEATSMSPNKPFKDISDYLAKNNITTIRYTKRFYEKPVTAKTQITIYDEYLDDVYWLIDYAKENFDGKIYVLGHSLGGMSVSKIAHDNPEVDGIISMAGTFRNLEDVIYGQTKDSLEISDLSQESKDQMLEDVSDGVEEISNINDETTGDILGLPVAYWRSLSDLKCKEYSKEIEIPFLIMQGKSDFQVSYEKDFLPWKELLKNKSNVSFKSYENLNHMFMPSLYDGKYVPDEYTIQNNVDEKALNDIVVFINGIK